MVLQKIPEWFYGTPVGKKMRENDARQVAQGRQEHVDAIKKLQSEGKRALAKLDPRLDKAAKALAEAKTVAKAAEQEFNTASNAKRVAMSPVETEVKLHEKVLRETADPAIGEFIEWIRTQWTNRRYSRGRVDELRKAVAAAEQLKLTAYTDVQAEIEKITKAIPPIADRIVRRHFEENEEDRDGRRPWVDRWKGPAPTVRGGGSR